MLSTTLISAMSWKNFELAAGEDLNGNVDLVLADPPYNVRKNRDNEHADHDVFTLEDIKGIAGVLEEVTKPGGHEHGFCSAL